MNIIVTERSWDGFPERVQSQDGRFIWRRGGGADNTDGQLIDTQVGAIVYQMLYCYDSRASERVPQDVVVVVREFYDALSADAKVAQAAKDHAEWLAYRAEIDEARRNRYHPEITGAERTRREREHDLMHNEGGEGYNPWRDM